MDYKGPYSGAEEQWGSGETPAGTGDMPRDEVSEELVFVHDKRGKDWLALRPGDSLIDTGP